MKIEQFEKEGVQYIAITGNIDENSVYPLKDLARGRGVTLNLAGVNQINSTGIQGWIKFIEILPEPISIEMASVSIVQQINMFPGFMGQKSLRISSIYAPFFCEKCDESALSLIELDSETVTSLQNYQSPKPKKCKTCGQIMEFDGLEKRYFAFLHYPTFQNLVSKKVRE